MSGCIGTKKGVGKLIMRWRMAVILSTLLVIMENGYGMENDRMENNGYHYRLQVRIDPAPITIFDY